MGVLVNPEFLQSLTVQSADEVNIDLLSGLQSQAIYIATTFNHKQNIQDGKVARKRLTMLPLWGLSVNSATVSPVLPSYRKSFESEPTLAKWSPDGEYFTSWTNLLCVLIDYKMRSLSLSKQEKKWFDYTHLFVFVRSACMEDDDGIVTGSCCSEWSLVSDGNRVYHLGVINEKVWNYDIYLKKVEYLTFECPRISPVEEPVSIRKAWPNLVSTRTNKFCDYRIAPKITCNWLFFAISNRDDSFTFAIPCKVITRRKKGKEIKQSEQATKGWISGRDKMWHTHDLR